MIFFLYILLGDVMHLADLQEKSIVNVNDGKLIGNIIDAVISDNGYIEYLIVEKSKFIVSRFSNKDEINISWDKIRKIGEDVILVEIEF